MAKGAVDQGPGFHRVLVLVVALTACATTGRAVPSPTQQRTDFWEKVIASAKARGDTSVSWTNFWGGPVIYTGLGHGELDYVSVWLFRTSKDDPIVVRGDATIWSWHRVSVERTLWTPALPPAPICKLAPPGALSLPRPDDRALVMEGGTTTLQGITITVKDDPAVELERDSEDPSGRDCVRRRRSCTCRTDRVVSGGTGWPLDRHTQSSHRLDREVPITRHGGRSTAIPE